LSHPKVQFAQGDNNTWTVTTLADPGDGVCDETDCTLREAIEAPVLGGNIVFASGLQGSIKLAAGSGSLTIPKNIKIDGDERITLDAVGGSRVLIAGGGINTVTVWLKGLGITGGVADSEGGGILAARASLILDHVTVFGNRSTSNGGGIDLFQSDATIVSSTISDNVSAVSGGGIYVNGGADLTLLNSTVFQNTADVSGGGIYNNETATVVTSTIVGNRAGSGGGLSNAFGSTGSVVGSTFSGNAATYGGGIGNSGTLQVRSSTVVDNVAESGAGVLGFQSMTVANSIIAGNRATVLNECDGSVGSLGHNLTAIGGCTFLGSGDVSVPVSAVFTEVLEPTLKDNGGPTQTHALIVRGRAVDRGYCPGETTDQRGFARPVDDATMPNALDACDIGAYELQGPVAAVADLMISQSVDKPSAKQGDKVTYTVRVQNLGPQTAPNVVVNDILSSGATFVEARSNVGALKAPPKGETGTVTWTLGDLLNGADEAATITVTVIIKGKTTITNVASVTGAVADPNAANNSASIAVAVGSGGSTKGGRKN
jgi:uncharacterized repeat protein (TIGR01451 family)/CSLREA domain-containing protein